MEHSGRVNDCPVFTYYVTIPLFHLLTSPARCACCKGRGFSANLLPGKWSMWLADPTVFSGQHWAPPALSELPSITKYYTTLFSSLRPFLTNISQRWHRTQWANTRLTRLIGATVFIKSISMPFFNGEAEVGTLFSFHWWEAEAHRASMENNVYHGARNKDSTQAEFCLCSFQDTI